MCRSEPIRERAKLICAQTGTNQIRDIVLNAPADFLSIIAFPVTKPSLLLYLFVKYQNFLCQIVNIIRSPADHQLVKICASTGNPLTLTPLAPWSRGDGGHGPNFVMVEDPQRHC